MASVQECRQASRVKGPLSFPRIKKNKTKREKLEKIGVEISRWEGEIIHLLYGRGTLVINRMNHMLVSSSAK